MPLATIPHHNDDKNKIPDLLPVPSNKISNPHGQIIPIEECIEKEWVKATSRADWIRAHYLVNFSEYLRTIRLGGGMIDFIAVILFILGIMYLIIDNMLKLENKETRWQTIYKTEKNRKEKAKAFFRKNQERNESKRRQANDKFNWLVFREKAKPLFATFLVYVSIRVYVTFFMLSK